MDTLPTLATILIAIALLMHLNDHRKGRWR